MYGVHRPGMVCAGLARNERCNTTDVVTGDEDHPDKVSSSNDNKKQALKNNEDKQ